MIKYLLILFLILSPIIARADTPISECSFTVTANCELDAGTCDSTVCETGTDTWTMEFRDCASPIRAVNDATNDYATSTNDQDDCQKRMSSTDDPSQATYYVQSDFIDRGTVAADDSMALFGRCITCTSTTTVDYYVVYSRDDNNSAYTLSKIIDNSPTSLGTGGGFQNGANEVIKLELRDGTKKVFEAGSEIISSTDNAITGAGVGGIGCGQINGVALDNCESTQLAWDDYSLVEIPAVTPRRVMIIGWLNGLIQKAYAQQTRDGVWYISPVVTKDGVRMPKAQTIPDPGKPMLDIDDEDGNIVGQVPQYCHMSNVIGDADISNEMAISYVKCTDYSALDTDPEIQRLVDADRESQRLNQLTATQRNNLRNRLNLGRQGTARLANTNTVREWLEERGKEINPQFNAEGTWVR